jgi:hypothetical protein
LRQLNGLLQERFPNKDDGAQANQLPDRPIVL